MERGESLLRDVRRKLVGVDHIIRLTCLLGFLFLSALCECI